jgi:hypothetical protein
MSIAFNETVASDELDLEYDVENTPEGKKENTQSSKRKRDLV